MRQALLEDPVQHAQTELMRRMLDAVDRAADEGVPEEARRRVVNRVVWGEPEGLVDVHAQMDRVRKQVLAAYDLPPDLTKVMGSDPRHGPGAPGRGDHVNEQPHRQDFPDHDAYLLAWYTWRSV